MIACSNDSELRLIQTKNNQRMRLVSALQSHIKISCTTKSKKSKNYKGFVQFGKSERGPTDSQWESDGLPRPIQHYRGDFLKNSKS